MLAVAELAIARKLRARGELRSAKRGCARQARACGGADAEPESRARDYLAPRHDVAALAPAVAASVVGAMKRKSPSSGAGSSSSSRSYTACPVCSASIPTSFLNEHLDRCLASSSDAPLATPLPPPPQPTASRQPTVSPRTTPPALADAPLARAFLSGGSGQLVLTPPPTATTASDDAAELDPRSSYLPGYASRLPADAFPGGGGGRFGGGAPRDARRVNEWSSRGAQPRSPTTAGDALAAVVRAVTTDAAPPALAAEAARIAGALDAMGPRGRALVALAFRGAGAWVRDMPGLLSSLPAGEKGGGRRDGLRGGAAGPAAASAAAKARWRAALAPARAAGLLEELTSESLRRRGGVASVRAPLATLLLRELRQLHASYGVPLPRASTPTGEGREAQADALVASLVGALRKRRQLDAGPLCAALGCAARVPAAVVVALRRAALVALGGGGGPREAAALPAARATSARAAPPPYSHPLGTRRRRRGRPPSPSSTAPRRRWPTATARRRSARCATRSRCSATAAPSTRRSWRPPSPPRSRAW